jgi:hypothetical protein
VTLFDLFENEPLDDEYYDNEADYRGPGTSPTCEELEDRATRKADVVVDETPPHWPDVEIRTSTRRRKTSEAKWVGNRIVVTLPAHLSGATRQKTIDWLVDRLVSKHQLRFAVGDDELLARARALSARYRMGVEPNSVRWVTNQTARWGSCSHYSREIRLSHRLRAVPDWVLDSVLMHELAHLVHPNHSPAFHRVADSYPRHKEAGIFLAGYGLGLNSAEGDTVQ